MEATNDINVGIHTFREPETHEPRTAVVLGHSRGGTSMVAKALLELGIYIGETENRPSFEDFPFSEAVERGDLAHVREVLAERNRRWEIWAWKRPSAYQHLELVEREFRNPYFIIVFRDVLAIAKRREITMGFEILDSMRKALSAYRRMIDWVAATDHPVLLVSYEKALRRPHVTATAIARFLGVEVTERAIASICAEPQDYIVRNRRRF